MPPESQITSDSDLESIIPLEDLQTKSRRNSTGPKYFCKIDGCEASFMRLDHLDRHEYKHTGIKKHACCYDDCDKSYTIVTHLKRHIRTTHERGTPQEKNVECSMPECFKMFSTVGNMQRHIREVHHNPKEYFCSHCNEKFTQKLKMRRHEITKHTGTYPFNCEKCNRGFFQQWQLERHTPSCKVYTCGNCSMQFEKWTVYLKHCREKQHGRKYYECESCKRTYSKPSELQKHFAAKHVVDDTESVGIYKCTEKDCERSYAYERNLRQHIRVAHSGKRFECTATDCTRCFSSAQNLTKHLARDHHQKTNLQAKQQQNTFKVAKRKKRKDAGKSIVSHLVKLSGLEVDKDLDKLLRVRDATALNAVTSELGKENVTDATAFDTLLSAALEEDECI